MINQEASVERTGRGCQNSGLRSPSTTGFISVFLPVNSCFRSIAVLMSMAPLDFPKNRYSRELTCMLLMLSASSICSPSSAFCCEDASGDMSHRRIALMAASVVLFLLGGECAFERCHELFFMPDKFDSSSFARSKSGIRLWKRVVIFSIRVSKLSTYLEHELASWSVIQRKTNAFGGPRF